MAVEPNVIPEDTQVFCQNTGSKPVTLRWSGRKTVIQPGKRAVVNYYAMCIAAGDPRSIDISRKERYRTDEARRLDTLYGVYEHTSRRENGWTDPRNGITKGQPGLWPSLRFYPIDDEDAGDYPTVLIDPDGALLNNTPSTEALDRDAQLAALNKRIEQMTRQMVQLEAEVRERPYVAGDDAGSTTEKAGPEHQPTRDDVDGSAGEAGGGGEDGDGTGEDFNDTGEDFNPFADDPADPPLIPASPVSPPLASTKSTPAAKKRARTDAPPA